MSEPGGTGHGGHLTAELLEAVARGEVNGLDLARRLIAHMVELCAECDMEYERWRRRARAEAAKRIKGEGEEAGRETAGALEDGPLYQILADAIERGVRSLGDTPEERTLALIEAVERAREEAKAEGEGEEPSSGGEER